MYMRRQLRDFSTLKLLHGIEGNIELIACLGSAQKLTINSNSAKLTSSFLGRSKQLVESCHLTIARQRLIPLLQPHNRNNKLAQILRVRHRHDFVTGRAWDSGFPARYIESEIKRREIRVDMRYAVIVEEETIVEARPLKPRFAKSFDALLTEGMEGKANGSGGRLL